MFWGEEDSPCQELPPEMIDAVLSFPDLNGTKNARLVCRRWRWILDQPYSRQIRFKQYYGMVKKESLKFLLNSVLHIDYLMVADLKASWPAMTYSRNKFPVIREIELASGNCEKTMITILQYGCTQTKTLKLGQYCFSDVKLDILSRMLSGVKWDQLSELSLKVTPNFTDTVIKQAGWNMDTHHNHLGGIEQIFKKAKVPNIRNLKLNVMSYEGNEISTGFTKVMSDFMTFIERHSNTLKSLALEICFRSNNGHLATDLPNIPSTFYSTKQQETIARTLKLESVEITAGNFGSVVHLMPPCVSESDQLTKLSWFPEGALDENPISIKRLLPPRDTPNPLQLLIQRNQNTLAHVTTSLIQGPIEVDPFQLSWLESCQALRELTFIDSHNMYNFRVHLPTVTKLNIRSDIFHTEDPHGNLSNWVQLSFPNLQIVNMSVTFAVTEENWLLTCLQNFLLLPRLREIVFRTSVDHSHFLAETLLRQFCNDKPGLMLRTRHREQSMHVFKTDLCLCQIKILPTPTQNDN